MLTAADAVRITQTSLNRPQLEKKAAIEARAREVAALASEEIAVGAKTGQTAIFSQALAKLRLGTPFEREVQRVAIAKLANDGFKNIDPGCPVIGWASTDLFTK